MSGAVVISGRAKKKSDVGKATMIGFLGTFVIYALLSIFCFGIMNQPELASLKDLSMAYVLAPLLSLIKFVK